MAAPTSPELSPLLGPLPPRGSVSPPPASKLVRPATLPALGRNKAAGTQADRTRGAARAAPPELPAEVRQRLSTHVPEKLAETLYLHSEAPSPRGASADTLEVLTFHAPDTHTTYLITTAEGRLDSSAKRRRWALPVSADGTSKSAVLCCLEFKQPHEMGVAMSEKEHLGRIQQELTNLTTFNRDIEVYGLLRSADGNYLALMTNLPEEGSYLLDQVSEPLFDQAVLKFFADATERLHEDVHAKGYVHGDFKLSNVMVTDQGRASLIDLDSLQPVDAAGQADIRSTTFTPPEQTAAHQSGFRTRFGRSGDVFAVGLALFDAYAERDAKAHEMAAERASPGVAIGLQEKADEIRTTKSRVLHDMTSPDGPFFSWRNRALAGGYDAQRIARDSSAYARSVHCMQQRAPQLFEHWMTTLSSGSPEPRQSLEPTLVLLSHLRAQPDALKVADAVEQEVRDIAAESLSAFVVPALVQAARDLHGAGAQVP